MPAALSEATRPRLVSEGSRFWLATAVSAALAVGWTAVIVFLAPDRARTLPFVMTLYFGAWASYALTYVLLTWARLRSADGTTLRNWLSESRASRLRRKRVESLVGTGGPAGAVSFCLLALAAVIGAAVIPSLRADPLVITLAVCVVVTTWLLIVTVFALHYAREDAHRGGLRFPGFTDELDRRGRRPQFADYTFLSIQVSTSYTSADVSVTGTAVRRALFTHAVVAFVFNSVLIALLVSLLTLNASS